MGVALLMKDIVHYFKSGHAKAYKRRRAITVRMLALYNLILLLKSYTTKVLEYNSDLN